MEKEKGRDGEKEERYSVGYVVGAHKGAAGRKGIFTGLSESLQNSGEKTS